MIYWIIIGALLLALLVYMVLLSGAKEDRDAWATRYGSVRDLANDQSVELHKLRRENLNLQNEYNGKAELCQQLNDSLTSANDAVKEIRYQKNYYRRKAEKLEREQQSYADLLRAADWLYYELWGYVADMDDDVATDPSPDVFALLKERFELYALDEDGHRKGFFSSDYEY